MTKAIVLDAEPLIAYFTDEPGADVVEKSLEKITQNGYEGFISSVQLTEIRYILGRICTEDHGPTVRVFTSRFQKHGGKITDSSDVWDKASKYKSAGHSLGDSYALATAERIADRKGLEEGAVTSEPGGPESRDNVTLLVGVNDDFDDVEIERVEIKRFRDEPA